MKLNILLKELRITYGEDVLYTNGLFHIIDNDHSELYINPVSRRIDNRGKYRTIAVLANVIIAEVLTKSRIKYVVLSKFDLKALYKTNDIPEIVADNLICFYAKDKVTILSHKGKRLCVEQNVIRVEHLAKNYYLLKSRLTFSDKVLYYDRHKGHLINLSEDRRYIVDKSVSQEETVEVTFMGGTRYTYSFKDEVCFNCFTSKVERQTFLWNII